MGSLILPPNGPVYLDTSGFIYSVERIEPYRTLLAPVAAGPGWTVCHREQRLGRVGTLVKPLHDNDLLNEASQL